MSSSAKKKSKPSGGASSAATKAKKAPEAKKKAKAKEPELAAGRKPETQVVAKKATPKVKAPAKKEPVQKPAVKAAPMHLGPPPSATILSRFLDSTYERGGRGFSFGELKSAGVPLNVAKDQRLSIDVRRRTVIDNNVASLKTWLKTGSRTGEK